MVHEHAGVSAGSDPGRRALLVSYHFGRGCQTGGIRWNSMARALVEEGWRIDVITLARPDLALPFASTGGGGLELFPVSATDLPHRLRSAPGRWARAFRRSRNGEAPAQRPNPGSEWIAQQLEAEVWKKDEPRTRYERLNKALDGIATWLADMTWSRRALGRARRLFGERKYRAVIVSSPPHCTQWVGARLSREYAVPYFGDYRDPWYFGIRGLRDYLSPVEHVVSRFLEPYCLRQSAVVIHNTSRARDQIAADLPTGVIRGAHLAIPNGYDATPLAEAPDDSCFRVAYTGWLYSYMDPRPLLTACRELRDARVLPPSRFRIEFVGVGAEYAGIEWRSLAAHYRLEDHFTWTERLPRDEARRIQQRAAVMVVYDTPHALAIPSKFYEYVQGRGTMLIIGDPAGAMREPAAVLGLRVYAPSDQHGINAALATAFSRWERGELDLPLDSAGHFDRRHQSERVQQLLNQLPDARQPS